MGNSSAKKTNNLLDQQRNLTTGFGNQLRGYGEEDRGYNTGQRGKITDEYWNLYNGVGDDGSGGGGGGYTPTIADARMNEAMDFYRKAQNTGLYSDQDRNDLRSRAGMNAASTFGGLQRSLDQGANVRGGGFAGYSGQRALLARDKARQIDENRLNNEIAMQSDIRKNMFQGGEGVGRYDTEYMNNLRQVEAMRNSAGAANASRGANAANQDFNRKMSILQEMRQLRGEQGTDLPYFAGAGNEYGQGLNAINSRQAETPWWQTALNTGLGVAGAAAPFLGVGKRPGQGGR